MKKQTSQAIFYSLLFFQGLISFILGIAGNKIAELTNISVGMLLFGTVALLGVSVLVSIVLLRRDIGGEVGTAQPNRRESFVELVLSRVITSFPFGIFVGLASTSIFIKAIWFPSVAVNLSPYNGFGFYVYELLSGIVLVISAYLINQFKQHRAIVLAYSLGFAIGASSAILALDFQYNTPSFTISAWLIVSLVIALLTRSSTINGIVHDIREMTTNITTKR